ncbi:counting factor associated protein D-like, partial [Aricia agestis]|uniref:counting factor associated protein D-like n=1 Tax=Aricia agestis TaxID=91739 RepID=UPI001C204459
SAHPLEQPRPPVPASEYGVEKVKEVVIEVPVKKPSKPIRPIVVEEAKPVQEQGLKFPSYVRPDQLDRQPVPPPVEKTESSAQLLQDFLAQQASSPELPPILLSDHDASERIPLPDEDILGTRTPVLQNYRALLTPAASSATKGFYQGQYSYGSFRQQQQQPPRPRFNPNFVISGELTVPRAGYTETYVARLDAATGSSRVDYYGGATVAFKNPVADGSLQRLAVRVDKTGENTRRICSMASSLAPAHEDLRNPALPDLDLFAFIGYNQTEGGRVEHWGYVNSGRPGELGGAAGEALTFHHDLYLVRAQNDIAIPLSYKVTVDSSVLGAATDGYEHRYYVTEESQRENKFYSPNLKMICDVEETLNATNADDAARLNPLREYTMPARDLRYDNIFSKFQTEYGRQYIDNVEEAVRKNLLIQHDRFIASGNREGAPSLLAKNFLTDRLNKEIGKLAGVQPEPENFKSEPFPHERSTLRAAESKLPKKFDWRPRGAVSPVKFQGASCSSCWAFSVAGAVEGALFIRRRELVPLSVQCLVDCSNKFGTKGCGRSWPSHAYDYVQNIGLPAEAEYPAYKQKAEKCQDNSIPAVTRISAHVNVTANSVPALKIAIKKHAPTLVIVDSSCKSFQFYKSGYLYDDKCSKGPKKLDHAVLAVGWGEKKGEQYFILKNSWSEAWGNKGYINVHGPSNAAGVLAKPSYPRLEDSDVIRDVGKKAEAKVKTRDLDLDDDYDDRD